MRYGRSRFMLTVGGIFWWSCALCFGQTTTSWSTVGSTTLVAWQTTVSLGTANVPKLFCQVLANRIPQNAPIGLTSTDARPGGVLAVRSLGDRFVALWNDTRVDNPGIYIRTIGLDGIPQGNERLLSVGKLIGDSLVWVIPIPDGYTLVWCDQRSSVRAVYHCSVDIFGSVVHPEELLDTGTVTSATSSDDLPGFLALARGSRPAIALYADGRIEFDALVGRKLTKPFRLHSDSTIAVIDDTVLRVYRTPWDSLPSRSIPLHGFSERIPATVLITDDASNANGYRILFCRLDSRLLETLPYDVRFAIEYARINLSIAGTDSLTVLDTVKWGTEAWSGGDQTTQAVDIELLCDGSISLVVTSINKAIVTTPHVHQGYYRTTYTIAIGEDGALRSRSFGETGFIEGPVPSKTSSTRSCRDGFLGDEWTLSETGLLSADDHRFEGPPQPLEISSMTCESGITAAIIRAGSEGPATLGIIDQSGRCIYSEEIELTGTITRQIIPVEGLPSGVYIVTVRSRGNMATAWMVVAH